VDLAPLGHAALHLNLKPLFTVATPPATSTGWTLPAGKLHDRHSGGLQLLAGTNIPGSGTSSAEFVRLFDMLVTHYRTS